MHFQKRTLALSYYVKARLYLVYFGFQQSSRNRIRYKRYSSKMVLQFRTNMQLPLWILFCAFYQRDTINVDMTVHTLKGIHTFRKDRKTQISRCSCKCTECFVKDVEWSVLQILFGGQLRFSLNSGAVTRRCWLQFISYLLVCLLFLCRSPLF